jgi:hypothetical protein
LSSFCSHCSRLIAPIEDTDIWFSVQCPKRFHLENCVMQFTAVVQRPERL